MLFGKTDKIDYDYTNLFSTQLGAITILDKKSLKDESIIDVSILSNNIQKIYKSTDLLANKLDIPKKESISYEDIKENLSLEQNSNQLDRIGEKTDYTNLDETESSSNEKLNQFIFGTSNDKSNYEYNEEILNYSCVSRENTSFVKLLLKIIGGAILFIVIISVLMLYTSFKMTRSSRLKDIGMLSSIGMSKKSRKSMLLKEDIILGGIRRINRNSYWFYIF